jgi:glycosyltransferase involved in cell wall biosynthesis
VAEHRLVWMSWHGVEMRAACAGPDMRILHLSSTDISGGAARAAYRIHQSAKAAGLESILYVGEKAGDDADVYGPQSKLGKLKHRVIKNLDGLPTHLSRSESTSHISPAWIGSASLKVIQDFNPDLIHLHWICHGFLSIESLPKLRRPLVWTLHDLWPLAGAEHYVGTVPRFREGYTAANRPANQRGWDVVRWTWKRKQRSYSAVPSLTVVGNSWWTAEQARSSLLFKSRRVEVIHYGLDHRIYKPIEQKVAREIFDLPADKRIILFGALDAVTDARKGFDLLSSALQTLSNSGALGEAHVAIFGSSRPKNPPDLGLPCRFLGRLRDDVSLAIAYAAADVMVVPSREEAFGQTALEALACGTPVVAFNIGGLPDMVEHLRNGYLARPFDVEDLAKGIRWVLSSKERWNTLSAAARNVVETRFTLELQGAKYKALYEEILAETGQGTELKRAPGWAADTSQPLPPMPQALEMLAQEGPLERLDGSDAKDMDPA